MVYKGVESWKDHQGVIFRFDHIMARFSAIISGAIFILAGLSAAGAQAGRPVLPGTRPQPGQPNAQQQQAPSNGQQAPRVVTAPSNTNAPQPGQPPTAPLKPSPNGLPPQGQANNPPTTPAVPPLVTYRDGMLTVQAANSTLGSVLTAIRNKTGIEFEGQENVVSDRVALSLGPAPAGEVLIAIFAGSKFDFLAIGRQDNPSLVQRVILTPKTQPGGAVAAVQPQPRPNGQEGEEPAEDTPDETPNAGGGDPQDTPAQPPAQAPPPENQQPQGPKSPEQLLQELQEMRKQQQQQQEGNPPGNPAQVPRKMPPR
jgi:hypothetical protein